MRKIVIIGCGNVGMAYAYSLVLKKGHLDELVLIDANKDRADGEALDLSHAAAAMNKHIDIYAGDYSDVGDASIVCICAGANQKEGETRLDLLKKNEGIFRSIITEINKTSFNGIYLIGTNPVDVMTLVTKRLSGFSPEKVIGSGTTLDTMRLRHHISKKLNVNPKNAHAYVIGEHGDSEFVPWSNAIVGLNAIKEYISKKEMNEIEAEVKGAAYEIINKKGNTAYGIGACLANISYDIFDDAHTIWSVSAYNEKYDIYFGMPSVIDVGGVKEVYYLRLDKSEEDKLQNSIDIIRAAVKGLDEN